MRCTAGCPTPGAHATWGDCMRAKSLRVAYCQSTRGHDYTAQKQADSEIALYRSAREQGVQPSTTKTRDIRAALDVSERIGTAFRAA